MDTVTTTTDERPEIFTVEYIAEALRKNAYLWRTDVRAHGFEFVKVFATNRYPGDELRDLQRIRNVLAAVELVHAEQAEAGR